MEKKKEKENLRSKINKAPDIYLQKGRKRLALLAQPGNDLSKERRIRRQS